MCVRILLSRLTKKKKIFFFPCIHIINNVMTETGPPCKSRVSVGHSIWVFVAAHRREYNDENPPDETRTYIRFFIRFGHSATATVKSIEIRYRKQTTLGRYRFRQSVRLRQGFHWSSRPSIKKTRWFANRRIIKNRRFSGVTMGGGGAMSKKKG